MASVRKRIWTSKGRLHSAWVCDYADAEGKRRLKTFETKKKADAWLVQAGHQIANGTHTPDREAVTVAAAGAAWLRRCEAERLEASTLRQYDGHLKHHIGPALGSVKLSRLTTPQVAKFADDMLRDHSRPLTRKVLVSLRALLKSAQRQGLVAQNVATAVRIGAQGRHTEKIDILAPDEVRKLLAAATGRFRPFLLVAIFTGLRASELRGLRWVDVDFESNKLTVSQRADENGVIGSPKSSASRRTLPMPPLVSAALRTWAAECPAGVAGLVFPNGAGRPESLANLQNRLWGPLQIACGLTDLRPDKAGKLVIRPRYGLHVLRHFYASWLIHQGFAPKRVQSYMGHATIKLTLDTYGHLWPDDAADVERLAEAETALLQPPLILEATSVQHDDVST